MCVCVWPSRYFTLLFLSVSAAAIVVYISGVQITGQVECPSRSGRKSGLPRNCGDPQRNENVINKILVRIN